MEEILSSIKRIIAEDSEATLSAPRAKRSVGLTPLTPSPASARAREDGDEPDVLELTDPVAVEPDPVQPAQPEAEPMPKPAPAVHASAPAAVTQEAKPALVSPGTIEASRSSLAALSALVVKPEITGTDTLEGLVREMLKPMLAEWLDARLPEVVDRLVAQEIRRITER